MNDVLPKPFTKEGLLSMLEKHLSHLKNHPGGPMDPMGAPPPPLSKATRSLKSEESPATSPATASNWNSPNNFSATSPASQQADDAYSYGVQNHTTPGSYHVQPGMPPPPVYTAGGPMGAPPRQQIPPQRRAISDISGGPSEMGGDVKRQQMYPPAQPQPIQPMQRPPPR